MHNLITISSFWNLNRSWSWSNAYCPRSVRLPESPGWTQFLRFWHTCLGGHLVDCCIQMDPQKTHYLTQPISALLLICDSLGSTKNYFHTNRRSPYILTFFHFLYCTCCLQFRPHCLAIARCIFFLDYIASFLYDRANCSPVKMFLTLLYNKL